MLRDVPNPKLEFIEAVQHLRALEFFAAIAFFATKVRHVVRSEKMFTEPKSTAAVLANVEVHIFEKLKSVLKRYFGPSFWRKHIELISPIPRVPSY